jgi:hypothetical protein
VTRKRSGPKPVARRRAAAVPGHAASDERPAPNPDAPITGVATGSLGTAANLDDTQVMRTADLQRAAAEIGVPLWLTDDAPPLPEAEAWPSGTVVEPLPDPREMPARERVQSRERVHPPERTRSRPETRPLVSRRTSALAGAAAGAALVLLAGAALLGNVGSLTPNSGVGQGPPFADSSQGPFATTTAEPTQQGKDCHGKGKDNGCKE